MCTIWQDILAVDSQFNQIRFFHNPQLLRDTNQLIQASLYLRRRSHLLREQLLFDRRDNNNLSSATTTTTEENQKQINHIRENYLDIRKHILSTRYESELNSSSSSSSHNNYHYSFMENNSISSRSSLSNTAATTTSTNTHAGNSSLLNKENNATTTTTTAATSTTAINPNISRTKESSSGIDGNSISEGYAFAGIKHIFDHHKTSVNRIRFAHNDASRLALASSDATISICRTWPTQQEQLLALLRGHHLSVVDLAWSNSNDYILSCSLDASVCLWNVELVTLARVYSPQELNLGEVLCCEFQPLNNNLFIVGGSRGFLQVVNSSTGKIIKNGRDKMGGAILSITFETSLGECLWVGNSQSIIQSYRCDMRTGQLIRGRRLTVSTIASPICSLQYRAWLSRDAPDPCLLVNVGLNYLLFFRVVSKDGQLLLKSRFPIQHKTERVRSCFCPLISFRQGACVVTGSEDTHVYVYDVTITSLGDSKCVTLLQGHSSVVTDVAISYDENVMASCDKSGIVILWKRVQEEKR